jgi:putative ABC transport system permease protein
MIRDLILRLRAIFKRSDVDCEIDEELRFHIERQTEAYEKAGHSHAEAARRARLEFGGIDQITEEYRDALGVRLLGESRRDVRLAFRTLRATPVVTAVAIVSLALGIGANTAIFSIIDSLLLRSLPVKDPARLVLVTDNAPTHVRVWSYPIWTQIHQRAELFERSAAWSFTQFNLVSGGETQFIDGLWASGSFFQTLGVPTVLGRTFSDADDQLGAGPEGPIAVISYSFWQGRFGGVADVIGRRLRLDDVPFTIVGVTPADFFGPEVGRSFDVIVPIGNEPLMRGHDSFLDSSGITFLTIIARLRPGQSLDAATAALRAVQSHIREATLGEIGRFGNRQSIERYLKSPFVLTSGARGYSGARDLRDRYERPLFTIMVVVVLLLLIACMNIANLLVARAIARRHELSLRLALGASRATLVRQLLTESVVLYCIGAAFGLALAAFSSRVLVRLLSTPGNTVFLDVPIDGRVLAFTVAMTVMTTLLFGTAPAIRASRVDPMDALKQHGRMISGQALSRLAGWLIVAQVALSLVLVIAAGLFVRTFVSLTKRPLGFEPAQVLVVNVDAHRVTNDSAQRLLTYERTRDAVRALPDVSDAALSLTTPIGSGQFTPPMEISGVPDTRGPVWGNLISPGWFGTFGTPLIAGRDLTDRDRPGAPRVAVVNEAFARKFAGGASPIGRTLTLYPRSTLSLGPIEVVGVVGDAVYGSLREPAPPTFYMPLAQFDYLTELGIRSINLSVRSKTDSPILLTKSISTAVATVNPQLALTPRPLVSQVNASLTQERLIALLAGFFGVLALLLAGLGLYGVTSYAVTRRRIEIGIRMALGAAPTGVVRLILGRVAILVGCGVALGAIAGLWASRFVASLLYGLEPHDPLTFIGAALTLGAIGAIAGWLPAWRASRIDPAAVLRES